MHSCNQVYLEVSEESPHFTCVHVRQALNLMSGIMRKDMQSTYSVYTCIYHVLSSKVWNINTCIYMILIWTYIIYVCLYQCINRNTYTQLLKSWCFCDFCGPHPWGELFGKSFAFAAFSCRTESVKIWHGACKDVRIVCKRLRLVAD